ncbi:MULTISPECIES: hypothetical protein [Chitinophagaceae]
MIVIVDINENIYQDGVMYVRNVDAAIEELFHNDIEGIVLTESVCASEVARLKAVVKTLDNEVIVLQKETTVEAAIQAIQQQLQYERLRQVTFSDPLNPENLSDQIVVS